MSVYTDTNGNINLTQETGVYPTNFISITADNTANSLFIYPYTYYENLYCRVKHGFIVEDYINQRADFHIIYIID